MSTITPASGIGSASIYDFQNTSEIPGYCTKLANVLAEQPLYEGRRALVKNSKVISLGSRVDARICTIFNTNATNILGNERRAWQIRDDCLNDQFHDSKGGETLHELTLWLDDSVNPCPIDELEKLCNQVLERFIAGWNSAKIEEHPDILLKKNPDDFYLFIKERTLSEEDVLIRLLAKKFAMQEDVNCHSEWVTHSEYRNKNKIYLWIKKTVLEDVISKFGFKLE